MRAISPLSFLLGAIILVVFCIVPSFANFDLTILHSGDTRANYLAVNVVGNNPSNLPCPPTYNETTKSKYNSECMGGWDTRTTFVNEVRARHGANNVLLLDSGDTLAGTLFFPLYKSEMASTYHGELGYDAWNVGVRDWDGGATTFTNYINELDTYNVKVVSTNLNFTGAGTSYSKVLQSATVNKAGTEIKIIGLASSQTTIQARLPSQVTLFPSAINRILQVLGTSKIVIMLSKADTYEEDLAIMDVLSNQIDIVVSSYNGLYYGNSNSIEPSNLQGPYPKVHGAGTSGSPYWLLVSPSRFGKGMGYLNVSFDDDGFITSWEGDHIWLNRTQYAPDPTVEADLKARYAEQVTFASSKVGETQVTLVGDGGGVDRPCRWRECNLGSIVADAMRASAKTDIAFVGSGALRFNITGPNVTYGDVLSVVPFLNNLASFQVQGQTIVNILEHSVGRVFAPASLGGSGRFLQVSGIRFSWNIKNEVGRRVISIQVFNNASQSYVDLDPRETYSVATTNFMYGGGDGYSEVGLPANAINAFPFGPLLTDLLIDYFSDKNGTKAVNMPDVAARIIPTEATEVFTPTAPVFPIKDIPDGLSIAFVVITGLFAMVPIILAGYIIVHRTHAVVVIASPIFCQIIIFGVLVGYLALFIYLLVPNNGGCMAFPWLGNYAFVIIFGSLFAKTWRIDRIFSRTRKLRSTKKPITNQTLFIIIGILILIETLIMGLWQGLSPLKYSLRLDRGREERRYVCSSQYGVYFFAASVAYKGILMVWGMYLVIKTRNIDSDFREATFIGWIIYAVFLTCAIIVTISLLLKGSILAVYILIVIGFWIVLGAVIGALFVPKVIEIWSNPDLQWVTYFQRRAESMRATGGGSITSYHSSSGPNDDIKHRLRNMKINEKQELLEEFKNRHKAITQTLADLEKDIQTIENSISGKSNVKPKSSSK